MLPLGRCPISGAPLRTHEATVGQGFGKRRPATLGRRPAVQRFWCRKESIYPNVIVPFRFDPALALALRARRHLFERAPNPRSRRVQARLSAQQSRFDHTTLPVAVCSRPPAFTELGDDPKPEASGGTGDVTDGQRPSDRRRTATRWQCPQTSRRRHAKRRTARRHRGAEPDIEQRQGLADARPGRPWGFKSAFRAGRSLTRTFDDNRGGSSRRRSYPHVLSRGNTV